MSIFRGFLSLLNFLPIWRCRRVRRLLSVWRNENWSTSLIFVYNLVAHLTNFSSGITLSPIRICVSTVLRTRLHYLNQIIQHPTDLIRTLPDLFPILLPYPPQHPRVKSIGVEVSYRLSYSLSQIPRCPSCRT